MQPVLFLNVYKLKCMGNSIKFWDRVAALGSSKASLSKTALQTYELTQAYLKETDKVLDFGCGNGALTLTLAKHVTSITAIDTSKKMLDAARAKANSQSIENVIFQQKDLLSTPKTTETYDAVLLYNVLNYIDRPDALLKQFSDLLNPKGLVICSTACLNEHRGFLHYLMLFLSRIKLLPEMEFYDEATLKSLFTSHEFKILDTVRISKLPEYFVVSQKE